MNLVEELRWRGMVHDFMPGTEELLNKEKVVGYVGIDPTADSLHIGHLAGIMLLKHLQRAGHKPLALIGGATGMIGDPSGKSEERNLMDESTLRHNESRIKEQLKNFLDFDDSQRDNAAELVNNYDWMKNATFLEFIRDIGKHITVNYMMSKDSVQKRLSGEGAGMSFTEFSYQLVQGNDFLHLYKTKNCKLQMGGSDQWGNITTGTELIRRKTGGEAYALTCPLITKADGGKFGKTETGNVWLDPKKTSPYKFYQFWLNTSDADAEKYIRIFTVLSKEEIDEMISRHREVPHKRELQKTLAREITIMTHSREDYESAVEASRILFGKSTADQLKQLPEQMLLDLFEGVPQHEIAASKVKEGVPLIEFLAGGTSIFPSKGEARRMAKDNGISINKEKVKPDYMVNEKDLIGGKYIIAQKGKKNYFLVIVK